MLLFRFYIVEAWLNSYAETVYHVGNENERVVLDEIKQRKYTKPLYQPKARRPKTSRRSSQGEKKKVSCHCSSCGEQGYNQSTCKYIMLTPSTTNTLTAQAQVD